MLECSTRPELHRPSWPVGSTKVRRVRPMQALGLISNLFASYLHAHSRMKIRQAIGCPRGPDRRQVRRIQAKEIDARLPIQRYVRSNIEFGETREPRYRRKKSRPNPAHAKGNDANPGISVELIQGELQGNHRAELRNGNRPVGKQKVMPDLPHDPRRIRRRISPVSRRLQQRVHRQVYKERNFS